MLRVIAIARSQRAPHAAAMVLELGAEGCQYNYVVTAHRPTGVQHAAVGRFTAPADLTLLLALVPRQWVIGGGQCATPPEPCLCGACVPRSRWGGRRGRDAGQASCEG